MYEGVSQEPAYMSFVEYKRSEKGEEANPRHKRKIKYYESINNSSSMCTRAAHVTSNILRFYYEEGRI